MWQIVDCSGVVWPERAPALVRQLSSRLAPAELRSFVARNMGYITMCRANDTAMVYLNPALVAPLALARGLLVIASWRPRRGVLGWYDEGELQHEIVGDGGDLAGRLSQLVTAAKAEGANLFHRRRVGRAALGEPSLRPLAGVTEGWQTARHSGDGLAFLRRLEHGRFFFAELDTGDQQFYVRGVSPDLHIAAHFPRHTRQPITAHPDRQYADWIARQYAEALLFGEPLIDRIDVRLAMTPGEARADFGYTRLLLPLSKTLLLCTSIAA